MARDSCYDYESYFLYFYWSFLVKTMEIAALHGLCEYITQHLSELKLVSASMGVKPITAELIEAIMDDPKYINLIYVARFAFPVSTGRTYNVGQDSVCLKSIGMTNGQLKVICQAIGEMLPGKMPDDGSYLQLRGSLPWPECNTKN
jgi:hypothetical protein